MRVFTALFPMSLALALTLALAVASGAFAQDAGQGQKIFNKCKACHTADQDTNKVGPSLKGVIGRMAGTYAGYSYSPAMKEAGEGGLVWNDESLTNYLRTPKHVVPKTKMAFAGLKTDEDIANVIAYLKQFSRNR